MSLMPKNAVNDRHDAVGGNGPSHLRQVGHGAGVVAHYAQGLDDDRQQIDRGCRSYGLLLAQIDEEVG